MINMAQRSGLQETDYFLVNRSGVDYKCTFGDITEYLDTPPIVYEVVMLSAPSPDSPFIELTQWMNFNCATYKLQEVVPYDADDPTYHYRFKKKHETRGWEDESWQEYDGKTKTVSCQAEPNYDRWKLECKYTYQDESVSVVSDPVAIAAKHVVKVTDPVIDPDYVIVQSRATGTLTEYKLETVTRGAAPPKYEYTWCYEYNGGQEKEDRWQTYNGKPNAVQYNWRSGVEKYYIKTRYTYDGVTENCESNRVPERPKPGYMYLHDYLGNSWNNLGDKYNVTWVTELNISGELWAYAIVRYNAPDTHKNAMWRVKISDFQHDKFAANFEEVFKLPDSSIDGYGEYTFLTPSIILKNRDYNYWMSKDTGKTWENCGRVHDNSIGRDVKIDCIVAKLGSGKFKVLSAGSTPARFEPILVIDVSDKTKIIVDSRDDKSKEWGYYWHFNFKRTFAVPDNNGYFFGQNQTKDTYYRWTDPKWNTTPESMAVPAYPNTHPNSYTEEKETLWDDKEQAYMVSVQFKENVTNTILGTYVYKFAWGDKTMTHHGFESKYTAWGRYDYFSKVIVRGKAVGWSFYNRNGSHWFYDADNYQNMWDCNNPQQIYMSCGLNYYTYSNGGSFLMNSEGYCK